ncbi:MAG: shikimate kinase [Candidatus Sabulitectum sp.]|nr:shikimate kinase [Candidatus Sabulitectum sp.]
MRKNIIALAGPPCSGKSTVGKILAVSLQADLIDLDDLVQCESGHTIEWIFSHDGEGTFRAMEKRILEEVLAGAVKRTVVALGGGALLDLESRKLIEEKTVLITLYASPETLSGRNSRHTGRPLAGDPEMLMNLIRLREKHYSSLGNTVNTEKDTAEDVAETIRIKVLPLLSPEDRLS